jgi:peptide-methionine (S)-S-oxide reductase
MAKISNRLLSFVSALLMPAGMVACNAAIAAPAPALPNPSVDAQMTPSKPQTAVFAGGCFWGVQAVFEHVKGVKSVTAGYAGGGADTAQYETVSSGTTGHAESVSVTYDPSKVTYGTLLKVFFSVAHDPTTLNRQGPDSGTQYRSVIFYANPDQKRIAEAYIAQLNQAKTFARPIVTQVSQLHGFYPAEDYHQDYLVHNPHNPYIVINDAPKIVALKESLPDLYTTYQGK